MYDASEESSRMRKIQIHLLEGLKDWDDVRRIAYSWAVDSDIDLKIVAEELGCPDGSCSVSLLHLLEAPSMFMVLIDLIGYRPRKP